MNIEYIVCPEHIEEKIESKHHVTVLEARQVLLKKPRIRFAEKGYIEEMMCMALLDRLLPDVIWPYSLSINLRQRQRSLLAPVI